MDREPSRYGRKALFYVPVDEVLSLESFCAVLRVRCFSRVVPKADSLKPKPSNSMVSSRRIVESNVGCYPNAGIS